MTAASLYVSDVITGPCESAVARYILHPLVCARQHESGDWLLSDGDGEVRFSVGKGRTSLVAATYSPEFGMILDTTCLLVMLDRGLAEVTISWN